MTTTRVPSSCSDSPF